MSVNHKRKSRIEAGVRANTMTNAQRAEEAWGSDMPGWVRLLASHCDLTNQSTVAKRLKKSGPYISRILSKTYTGSYKEAEQQVRAVFGEEGVVCPIWNDTIPLKSCIATRRRKAPPQHHFHLQYARTCPTCPNNTDGE